MADFAAEHLIRQLGDQLASLARQIEDVKAGQGAPQLGNSSVENSHVRFNDSTGSQRVQVGLQQDGGHGVRIDQGYVQGVDSAGVMRTNIDGNTATVYGNNVHLRCGGPSPAVIEGGFGNRVEFMQRTSGGSDIAASQLMFYARSTGSRPVLLAPGSATGLVFDGNQIAVITGSDTVFGPISASAFNVASSAAVKRKLGRPDWDGGPLGAARRSGVELFQYHAELNPPEAAGDGPHPEPPPVNIHIGPMWEQLPEELRRVSADGTKLVAAHDLAGLALAAITQLADEKDSQLVERDKQIAELTARLERLEAR